MTSEESRLVSEVRSQCQQQLLSVLRVKVISGRKLYKTDLFTKIDPFIKVKFGQDVSTSVYMKNAGSDVEFDWNVCFPFDPEASEKPRLELIVMDHDTLRPDDVVGAHTITHEKLVQYQGQVNALEEELQLTRDGILHSDKPAGFLKVHIYWHPQPCTTGFPIPTLYCISNHNYGGGIIRELLDGGKFETFRTWQMNLWMLHAVFKDETCGWNQSYKAAQMIYGKDAKAKIVRKVIKAQHSTLYSKDKGVGSYQEYEVHGLLDFYQTLCQAASEGSGLSKKKSSSNSSSPDAVAGRRYTYVILPDATMHFSRTGKATAQDFLSKHALHCCAKKSVVYAGEFFFDLKIEPQPTLIIDNNSGTFAPPKEKLPYLLALLELNFGLEAPIRALDRDDPELQRYFEANEIQ